MREINRPLGLTTAERLEVLRRPWRSLGPAWRLIGCWASLVSAVGRARWAGSLGSVDAVVVGYLAQFDVLVARVLFPRRLLVIDLLVFGSDTARDRGVAGRGLARALDGLDRLACRAADLVVVDTDENADLVPAAARSKVVVVPVGAPPAWSLTDGPPPVTGPLRVVFFGLYTPLQGAPYLGRALRLLATENPGAVEVTMVGQGQDREAARAEAGDAPGVTWLDWVEPEELPALVAGHDVCLGIFGTTTKAARVVPNKVFQGASAGCAIITSDTPPQRRVLGDAALYVPPGDPVAIARALRRLAADRDSLRRYRCAARALAADRFGPATVVGPLRDRLYCGQA